MSQEDKKQIRVWLTAFSGFSAAYIAAMIRF
jgi:hypothetical protein